MGRQSAVLATAQDLRRVIKTSGQVRTAYKQVLAGKSADVRAAEVFHAEAMRKAKDAIRKMLEAAGNSCIRRGDDADHRDARCVADDGPARPVDQAAAPHRIRSAAGRDDRGAAVDAGGAEARSRRSLPAAESDRERKKREADQQELAMAKERLAFCRSRRARGGGVAGSRQANARPCRAHARAHRERARGSHGRGEGRRGRKSSASESALQKAKAETRAPSKKAIG